MPDIELFYRLILRPLRRERLRTALTVLAVALGVAAVLAIELAGQAATGSFHSSLETLTGNANLEVTSPGGISPEVFTHLALAPYPLKLRPRIEDYGVIDGAVKRTVPIIGIDVLSEGTAHADEPILNLSKSVFLSPGLGYKIGDHIRLLINDTASEFTVGGLLTDQAGAAVVMDLAPATRLLRRAGRLDRILIDAPPRTPSSNGRNCCARAFPTESRSPRKGPRRKRIATCWTLSAGTSAR